MRCPIPFTLAFVLLCTDPSVAQDYPALLGDCVPARVYVNACGHGPSSSIDTRYTLLEWDSANDGAPSDLVTGATIGWGLGLVGGGLLGYGLVDSGVEDQMIPGGTILGAFAGAAFGAPLGAHLMNQRRGHLLIGTLASAAIGYGGLLLSKNTTTLDAATGALVGMAVAQIVVTANLERLTERIRRPRVRVQSDTPAH